MKKKELLKKSSAAVMACICLLATGCSNSKKELANVLTNIGTNTNGKVVIKMEIGTFGRKATFIFEDVDVKKIK